MSKSNCIRLETEIRPRRCVRHGQTDTTSEMRVQFRRRSSDASNEMHKLLRTKRLPKARHVFLGKD